MGDSFLDNYLSVSEEIPHNIGRIGGSKESFEILALHFISKLARVEMNVENISLESTGHENTSIETPREVSDHRSAQIRDDNYRVLAFGRPNGQIGARSPNSAN